MRNFLFIPAFFILSCLMLSCRPSQKEIRDKQIADSTNKAILFADSILKAQHVKDFFLPKSEYFGKVFQFETEKWENEEGQLQIKSNVTYFKDSSGNYKKYTQRTFYRYNVPQLTSNIHDFYYVGTNKINFIYSYMEGISKELKQLGYIDDNNMYKTILKLPPAQWIDKLTQILREIIKVSLGRL